jgi:two-component system, LytTR family, response regulator LytT
MRVAIVEDEAVVARRLERKVREILPGCTIEIAESLEEAVALTQSPLDLLFLDLNLQGDDGFLVLEHAAAARFATVVVSAHHDEALRAFDYGVADFVAKPWSEDRLRRAIERVRRNDSSSRAQTLVVRKGREVRSIQVARIVYVRGADDYSELHLDDGSTHLHEKSLAALETLLPESFARVHRSFIVNGDRVAALQPAALRLDDGSLVPVGRVYRAAARARLTQRPLIHSAFSAPLR